MVAADAGTSARARVTHPPDSHGPTFALAARVVLPVETASRSRVRSTSDLIELEDYDPPSAVLPWVGLRKSFSTRLTSPREDHRRWGFIDVPESPDRLFGKISDLRAHSKANDGCPL